MIGPHTSQRSASVQMAEPRQSAVKEPAGTQRYALRSRKQHGPSEESYKVRRRFRRSVYVCNVQAACTARHAMYSLGAAPPVGFGESGRKHEW